MNPDAMFAELVEPASPAGLSGAIATSVAVPSPAQILGNTSSVTSRVTEAGDEIPLLFKRKAPQYQRQQEQAWHRIALELAAKGFTAKEISEQLGCSPTAVQDILRQPQYQQTQVALIRNEVNRDRQVVEHIKEKVLIAVETLSDIVEDKKAKPADRIMAARELLNRRYGMPNQPINRNSDVDLNKLSDSDLTAMLTDGTGTLAA